MCVCVCGGGVFRTHGRAMSLVRLGGDSRGPFAEGVNNRS